LGCLINVPQFHYTCKKLLPRFLPHKVFSAYIYTIISKNLTVQPSFHPKVQAAPQRMFNQAFSYTLLLMALLVATRASAQQPQATNLQRFGVAEGLPQSFVSGITQDSDGFIWFSTLDGMSRYDGRNFKNFRNKNGDTTSLSANSVFYLLPHPNNTTSIIYDGFMIDEFDFRTARASRDNTLDRLRQQPGALWKLHNLDNLYNGRDWVFVQEGYKGVGWVNRATGKVRYANRANGLLQQDTLSAFLQTPEGQVYLVSENGVQVSDAQKQKFTFYAFATSIAPIPSPLDQAQLQDTRSVALLPGNRLAVYDANRIIVLHLAKKKVDIYPIPAAQRSQLAQPEAVIKTDSKGQLYFKHNGRIFRMAPDGTFTLLWENNVAPQLNITAFFIDRSDVLWVSVNAQGIFKINLGALPFQAFAYTKSFVPDVLAHAGIPRARIPEAWNDPYAAYYFRNAYDSAGVQYLTCNYYQHPKVYRFDGTHFTALTTGQPTPVFSALITAPGQQVRVFDEQNMAWNIWDGAAGKPTYVPADPHIFKDVVLADGHYVGGYYWLSSYSHGLFQLQGEKVVGHFTGKQPVGVLPKELTEICADPTDPQIFWIGSRGSGLVQWHVSKGLMRVYTTEDGLPNNTVYCILPDKKGNIWCSTNKGIFRLNTATAKVTAFEQEVGLSGNEFNRAHKFLFQDGRMAFGGLDGYTIFDPADFEKAGNPVPVPIQITALQVDNQLHDIQTAGDFVHQPLAALEHISLPHHKNYLRIEFAAMAFNQPHNTAYRYRLSGTGDEWMENGTNNVVAYAGLQPGTYTFQVNATGPDGLWSPAIKELTITIRPPLWATWWAYVLYALALSALLRAYFLFREKSIRTQQSLAFEKKEALRLRELEAIKDRFFSNVTHEFRTPLTLIITPLEKLAGDSSLNAAAAALVATAQKSSRQLLRLINEFLDFSKLNDGQMRVQTVTGDLHLFTAELVDSFKHAAQEKNITLTFESKDVAVLYQFDGDKWEKICSNLVSNAVKFTPPAGSIAISLEQEQNGPIRLQVANTGAGIPAHQQQRIFERFYQADEPSVRHVGGTGIGLALVKDLVELMQGSIEVQSEPDVQTMFTVRLPFAKAVAAPPAFAGGKRSNSLIGGNGDDSKTPVVLVVEDNEELRHFLAESLEQRYRILQAADGAHAWEIVLAELPDIIISDVMMPGMDGFDLCGMVKKDLRTAHTCFILLTSKGAHDSKLKGINTGADDYITKPFQLAELEGRIANLLQQQEKTRTHLSAQLLPAQPQELLPKAQDAFLQQLYAAMDARLGDADLDVAYLCAAMAMSRSTLNRKLKTLLDTSANDLIRQYRLQHSVVLLSSGLDMATIAYQVGFSSPSYFSQCFREQFGITPTEYAAKMVNS
jgi:signal transduction histidine kinase/DNA-binding response OmpR family regulator